MELNFWGTLQNVAKDTLERFFPSFKLESILATHIYNYKQRHHRGQHINEIRYCALCIVHI